MTWGATNERSQPNAFEAVHWMGWRMPDGAANVTLSGVALTLNQQNQAFKGNSVQNWLRDDFQIVVRTDRAFGLLNLPAPDSGKVWDAELVQWVVYGTPCAIGNDGPANNAGWAVDRFGIDNPETSVISDLIISFGLAVRDNDGWLFRIAYWVNFIARVYQRDIPQPGVG